LFFTLATHTVGAAAIATGKALAYAKRAAVCRWLFGIGKEHFFLPKWDVKTVLVFKLTRLAGWMVKIYVRDGSAIITEFILAKERPGSS
jgi:hypothetical protein